MDYVGKIVCIFGDEKDSEYFLHNGINRIGTGEQMDVRVCNDMQITRDNHCSIVYDKDKNKFMIVPTAGSITYLNDNILHRRRQLNEKDIFRIGRSDFKLIKL